jgi:hypothetical protein
MKNIAGVIFDVIVVLAMTALMIWGPHEWNTMEVAVLSSIIGARIAASRGNGPPPGGGSAVVALALGLSAILERSRHA